jgi:Trk-type K+ transport system membrane component
METDLEAQLLIAEEKKKCCQKLYHVSMYILAVITFVVVVTVITLVSIKYFQRNK